MAATARDAQAGWHIYRTSGYSLELNEINARLAAAGFKPIAPRTYSHYRKLHRYGYQRYVPINQLDVETLRDPVWGGPLQSRYRPRPTALDLRMWLFADDDLLTLEGRLMQLSEVEGTARLSVGDTAIAANPTAIEGRQVLVLLGDDSRAASIELVHVDEDDQKQVDVTFVFLSLLSTEQITGRTGLGPSEAQILISTEDEDSPLVILRQLYSLFEAFDSARLVCDQALADFGLSEGFTFPPTRVKRLTVESPMLIELTIATAPLWVVAALVTRWEYLRKKHYEANVVRGQAAVLDAQASILQEKAHALRIRNEQAESRSVIAPVVVAQYVRNAVKASLPAGAEKSAALEEQSTDRVAELAQKQLLPDVENLLEAPIVAVNIVTNQEIPQLQADEDEEDDSEGMAKPQTEHTSTKGD